MFAYISAADPEISEIVVYGACQLYLLTNSKSINFIPK